MNWGLMFRWTVGLDNWEEYRKISDAKRTKLVRGWVRSVAKMAKEYPNLGFFGGGEDQPGSVGDINTIFSLTLKQGQKLMSIDSVKKIYEWMAMSLDENVTRYLKITKSQKETLKISFLLGQPVDMGKYAAIRVALGATLVARMNEIGVKKILLEDRTLLTKLSILTKNYHTLKGISNESNQL